MVSKKKEYGSSFDLHALEAFHRVMTTGSFSLAAKAMGLAQPTVSQHVASLESALGVRLLDRVGKAVRPTTAGRVLDEYVLKLLTIRDQAARAVALAEGSVRGTVHLAASTIPGTYLLPDAIRVFRDRYPHVAIEVDIADSLAVEHMVAEEEVPLGVTGTPARDRRVQGKPFWKDELVLILPAEDPWAKKSRRSVTAADLAGRSFIMREEGSGTLQTCMDGLDKAGMPPGSLKVVCRLGSTAAVMEAVHKGIGLSWVSRKAAERSLEQDFLGTVKVRGLRLERDCYLITRKKRTLSPNARAFYEVLENLGKKPPPRKS